MPTARRQGIDPARAGRLHILEVQRLIRFMPKVVLCAVPGSAAGGGHSLHVVCDLTIASREHARFKQTDADVASFDGGFGSAYCSYGGLSVVRGKKDLASLAVGRRPLGQDLHRLQPLTFRRYDVGELRSLLHGRIENARIRA